MFDVIAAATPEELLRLFGSPRPLDTGTSLFDLEFREVFPRRHEAAKAATRSKWRT